MTFEPNKYNHSKFAEVWGRARLFAIPMRAVAAACASVTAFHQLRARRAIRARFAGVPVNRPRGACAAAARAISALTHSV